MEPIKQQRVAVELIVNTQKFVRENDGALNASEGSAKYEEVFSEILPVTEDASIIRVFNRITPEKRTHLEEDMAKFYTFIALTSEDPNIDDKLVGPSLASAYIDYRASLVALQLRNASR